MKKTLCLILASMLGASAFGNLMMQIISTHNGPAVVIDGVTYYLPAYAVTEPTTNYPAGFAEFDFTPNTTNVSASAPQIAEWTRQNQPGDTMALTSENLDPTNSLFVFSDDGSEFLAGDILALDDRQCAVTLPDGLTSNAFYLAWPYNSNGFGYPAGINRTEAWWVGPNNVATGEAFSVYGQNLELGGGDCSLYIAEAERWLTSTNANPYRADFVVPTDLAAGTYTVYAHNGQGGKYGWGTALSLTVGPSVESYFSDDPDDWYDVTDPSTWVGYSGGLTGAVGDGVTDDYPSIQACIDRAKLVAGSTIYFPAGTYLSSAQVYPAGDRQRIKGAGMNLSKIQGSSDSLTGTSVVLLRGNAAIEDIEINKGDLDKITVEVNAFYGGNCRFARMRASCLDTNAESIVACTKFVALYDAGKFRFKDCEFIGSVPVGAGLGNQVLFENCTFLGVGDANSLLNMYGSECALVNCSARPYDASDATTSLGWAKGRWNAVGGLNNHSYYGGNSSTNMAPRFAQPFFREHPISVSAIVPVVPGQTNAWNSATQTFTFSSLGAQPAQAIRANPVNVGADRPTFGGTISEWNTNAASFKLTATYDLFTTEVGSTNIDVIIWDYIDVNSGEQFLWEGNYVYYVGSPASVTDADTLYFSDLSVNRSGLTFSVVSGTGMGQTSKITADSTSSGIVNLATPLRVLPDETSICKIGRFPYRIAVYDNELNGLPDTGLTRNTATCGVSLYGAAAHCIVDSNTLRNMSQGVYLWSSANSSSVGNAMEPNLFTLVKGNTLLSCKYGIANQVNCGSYTPAVYPSFYGGVYRENTISNMSVAAFSDFVSTILNKDLCVYDGNIVSSNLVTFSTTTETNLYNQVLIGNSFIQAGGTGLSISRSDSYVLQNNYWSGFSTVYSGSFSGPVIQIPQGTVLLSDASKTIQLLNTGTTGLTWTATENAAWLSVTASGAIAAESSGDMVLSRSGSTTNGAAALVSVVAAGTTNTFTVIYGDELGTP